MSEQVLAAANGTHANAVAEADVPTATVTPRVDVLETEDDYLVLADLPGVKPGDVDVRFENGEVAVFGRRTPSAPDRSWEAVGFARTFRVTDQIAADRIEAELKHGVLTLKLPKVEAVKPRRIAVRG